MVAARSHVAEHGFDAISMSAIARSADVSRASMYRYFASKEHVVGAAAIAWGSDLAARLPSQLAGQATVAGTVAAVLVAIVDESESDLPMLRAILACLLAPGPTRDAFRNDVRELFRGLLGSGAHDELALGMLGRLLLANLMLLSAGDIDGDECRAQLRAYAKQLMAV